MLCAINMNNYLYAHVCHFIAGSIWTCVSMGLFSGAFIGHRECWCDVSQPSPSNQNIWQMDTSSGTPTTCSNTWGSHILGIFLAFRESSCRKLEEEESTGFLDTLDNELLVLYVSQL